MLLNLLILEKALAKTEREVPADFGAKMRNRHRNALKKAFTRLVENPYIGYANGEMLILSDSITEAGLPKFYRTSAKECRLEEPGNVLCHAFWEGFPCWHRTMLKIVENYRLLESFGQKQSQETVNGVTGKVSPV